MCALVSSTKHQGDGSAPIFGKLTRDWRAVDCDNPKNSSEVTQWVRRIRKSAKFRSKSKTLFFRCFILVVIDIMMSVWNSIFGSYRSVWMQGASFGVRCGFIFLLLFFPTGYGRWVLPQSYPKYDGRTSAPISDIAVHVASIGPLHLYTKLKWKCFRACSWMRTVSMILLKL